MTNDSWINFLIEFITGVGGLILFILSVILAAYWLLMPMLIVSRLDKLIKLTSQEAERLRTAIGTQDTQNPDSPTFPKPIPPEAERFYVANGKDAVGPHDRETLTQLLQRQIITRRSLVCKEGGNQWQELGSVIHAAPAELPTT